MQIVKARAALTHEMKACSNSQRKEEELSGNIFPYSEHKPASFQQEHSSVPSGSRSESLPLEITTTKSTEAETEKRQIPSEEVRIIDKSVIQEELRNEIKVEDQDIVEDKDEDDWLKEDSSENVTGTTTMTTIPIENDEDVSFSDLEEDDGDAPANYKNGSDSSTKDSRDWVQLGSDSSAVEQAGPGQVSGVHNSEHLFIVRSLGIARQVILVNS